MRCYAQPRVQRGLHKLQDPSSPHQLPLRKALLFPAPPLAPNTLSVSEWPHRRSLGSSMSQAHPTPSTNTPRLPGRSSSPPASPSVLLTWEVRPRSPKSGLCASTRRVSVAFCAALCCSSSSTSSLLSSSFSHYCCCCHGYYCYYTFYYYCCCCCCCYCYDSIYERNYPYLGGSISEAPGKFGVKKEVGWQRQK